MTACGDAAMRDWLLVLVPFVFAVSWILYPEKFSDAAHWLLNLVR
jgi:hypothetical protein